MGLAIGHVDSELEAVARSFLTKHGGTASARATLDAEADQLPSFWPDLVGLGWLGLHLDEEHGGQGAGLSELAVVVEQLGAFVVPGPFLPTVLASAVIDLCGDAAQRSAHLPSLADGSRIATVGFEGSLRLTDGTLDGDGGIVLSAVLADLLLLRSGDDLVLVPRHADGVHVEPLTGFDPTRRAGRVRCDSVAVDPTAVLRGAHATAVRVGRALAAAEASGVARACTDMAVAYAKVREQFGRTIGTFQAIKHHCANMLIEAEASTAVAADAVAVAAEDSPRSEFAAAAAVALALPAAIRCAKLNTQVHGGIGYTWEHDAHVYVRRAHALHAVFGPLARAELDVTDLAARRAIRRPTLDLPDEAERYRAEVRAFRQRLEALPEDQRMSELIDSGYAFPHWPKPYGRSAGPVEQLVIEEELAGIPRPNLGIGAWITQTLASHANEEQTARWIRQSMRREITWCQLFSEPNAGSDAAAIQTRGVRTDGGWLVTGQKVWTSGAQYVTHGFATVRTDPDAPKHKGITMMVIDMKAPGVEVRPLREMSGSALFNEVFLDNVFVPDEDVVGPVNGGWTVARSTLGNERVSIGQGLGGLDGEVLLPLLAERPGVDDGHRRAAGRLIAQSHALRLLNLRRVARALAGGGPGPEGNVTKVLMAEHGQTVAELALELLGSEILDARGRTAELLHAYVFTRQSTIAGGTSEIARNQIAERILGLPRDPLLR